MLIRQAYCYQRLRDNTRSEELCREALALAPFSAEVTTRCLQWYPNRFQQEVERVAKAVTKIQAIVRGHQNADDALAVLFAAVPSAAPSLSTRNPALKYLFG